MTLEEEANDLNSELEDLKAEKARLKQERKRLLKDMRSKRNLVSRKMQDEYGFPKHHIMEYQKQMIREAIEHIFTHDTLKGLGEQ